MGDFSKDIQSDDDMVGDDAGVVLGSRERMHQERNLLVREDKRPVERQVLATAWGCWCW